MSEIGFEVITAPQAFAGVQVVNLVPSIAPAKRQAQGAVSGRQRRSAKMDGPAARLAIRRWNQRAARRRMAEYESVSYSGSVLSDAYLLDVERGRQGHTSAKRGCE